MAVLEPLLAAPRVHEEVLDYDLRVPDLLLAVTRDQVTAAARRTLVPSHATVVIAGPYAGGVR